MRKILLIVFTMLLLLSAFGGATAENSAHLVAEYNFDADNDSTVLDSTGNYNGKNNGATYIPGWNDDGKALKFNGSSRVDFSDPVIPIGKKSIYFKIRMSQKPANTTQYVNDLYSVMTTAEKGSENRGTSVFITADGTLLWMENSGVSGDPAIHLKIPNIDLVDNKWHEVLLTWDGSTNENGVKVYIDDTESPVYKGEAKYVQTGTASNNLRIGARYHITDYNRYFRGDLDDIKIYNDVINPTPTEQNPEPQKNAKLYVSSSSFYKLTENGDVFSWGINNYGQLGLGDTTKRTISQKEQVILPEIIVDIVVGKNFVVVLGESGKVYGWGDNASGVIGDSGGIITSPVEIDTDVEAIINAN